MAAQDFPSLVARARVEITFLAALEDWLPDGVRVLVEAPPGEEERYQKKAIEALQQRLGDSPSVYVANP